ncbi:MAG: glycyl-radical enzyme activating protein [Bacteroidota bacterium]|nr:glycyl-radical enzyme activating protein [Bacteroidota bacterium]
MKGLIFDIKRFAVHDGPGIRVTVFLKGCPLHCTWCHNPEGICPDMVKVPKTVRMGDKTFTETETVGQLYETAELMEELKKEQIFMEESGGGVTFSGGEPLMQADFLLEMLKICKAAGMHTAVDTTGLASWKTLKEVAAFTDLFLYDLKIVDEAYHRKYTGVSNKLILENLKRLLAEGYQLRVRLPLIPDMTYTEQNMANTLKLLEELPKKPVGVDLLPFHSTAAHKYKRFHLVNELQSVKSMDKHSLKGLKERFELAGFKTTIGG